MQTETQTTVDEPIQPPRVAADPTGQILVRKKYPPLGGPPSVAFVAEVYPRTSTTAFVARFTLNRREAIRLSPADIDRVLTHYRDRENAGEFTVEKP